MSKVFISRLLFLLFLVSLFLLLGIVFAIGLFYHNQWYHLKKGLGLDDRQMIELIRSSTTTELKQTQFHTNFLVLGVDALANREGDPVLTDTMILVSIDLLSSQIRAVSLPRDLWSPEYKTKINALYEYGKQRNPDSPEEFPTQVLKDLTGLPIHYTVVVSLDDLKDLINILGGVEVDVKKGFVDEQFPRTDVDIRTERDPAKLYERVEFVEGKQQMTGEKALQFIRSRKSSDLEAGTDDARTVRQQALIIALMEKIKQRTVLSNAQMVEQLAAWYKSKFSKYFSLEEVLALASSFGFFPSQLTFQSDQLSIESENQPGVIFHPAVIKYSVWVYEVKDQAQFRQELFTKLGLPVQ